MPDSMWERPDVVDQFAAREPDHRLARLVDDYADPAATPVLDLGCAGGRNTEFLARRGFDVHAVDASAAMVDRTRQRLAPILGDQEARRRVRVGRMDDLSAFPDASFALVVALGVYHAAASRAEWDRAIAESARVLKPGGRLLVNQFTPEVDLTGEGVRPVPDQPGVYDGMPDGRGFLLHADQLDDGMRRHGLLPLLPSQTVRVDTDRGRRVSVNALYAPAP